MTQVGVAGARGRMGQEVCRAVEADADLELVAQIDEGDDVQALVDAGCDVVVDFTVAAAARETLPVLAANGIHAVVGTSGLSEDDHASLGEAFTTSNCLVAPNFAIGAVLMTRFAEIAAPFFETAEIVEYHHNAKVDAPSGTATHTAERMAAAKADWADDPTEIEVFDGARGGEGPAGIRVHAVRMKGVVANQEVLLGTTGQTLTIRHDTVDRTSFMPGVVLACKRIADHPGLTIGLDSYLGL
ncbi:MAG: 4-hydroxy-tetrahydrodipicolinate reductase [Acidimicrobiales bacterium]|jgi:4-hydroxy-tetrahydrodipicolinate reductase|nr:4-hydroxy-tetrahydrodipicolinate reductase [Acidimicrobiales bacterium]